MHLKQLIDLFFSTVLDYRIIEKTVYSRPIYHSSLPSFDIQFSLLLISSISVIYLLQFTNIDALLLIIAYKLQ